MFERTLGLIHVTLPLPGRPASVNAYLAPLGEGGWMLVDGGIDSEPAWEALDAAVEETVGWSAVDLHVVTHMHVDHIGLARRVRERKGVPLAMGELDAARAAHAASDPGEEARYRAFLLEAHGAPAGAVAAAARPGNAGGGFVPADRTLPSSPDPVPLAGNWSSVWTPGHTAGHIALFRPRDRVLIAGDAVLPRVSPTIGVNRQRDDPVGDQIDTLARIEALAPEVILGGHGAALRGAARVRELRAELYAEAERVVRLLPAAGEAPASAWKIAEERYRGRELPPAARMQAFRETLAHLERASRAGGVVRLEEEGSVLYRRG